MDITSSPLFLPPPVESRTQTSQAPADRAPQQRLQSEQDRSSVNPEEFRRKVETRAAAQTVSDERFRQADSQVTSESRQALNTYQAVESADSENNPVELLGIDIRV